MTDKNFPELKEPLTPEQVMAAIDDIRDRLAKSGSPHAAAHGYLLSYLCGNHDDIASCSEDDTV